jgi:spermidine synthase
MTPGAALLHHAVEEITAIELSRTVAEAAAKWFSTENRGVMTHPRVNIVLDDGRTWIAACEERFDLIVADLFLPWGQGEARLYSREHFAAVRRALRPDGLFCQWLPMYQLTEEHFLSIAATLLEVFPAVEMVLCEADNAVQPVLGLLASRDNDWTWPSSLPSNKVVLEAGSDPLLADPMLLSGLHLGRFQRGDIMGTINTLDNLAVELEAGRIRITRPHSAPYLSDPHWEAWQSRFFEGR